MFKNDYCLLSNECISLHSINIKLGLCFFVDASIAR